MTVYCRLPRAAKACDITQRLVPPGADALADDADGPQVSAVNDQVTILSHRYPQPVPKPGGDPATEDTTLYLWTSDDGGANFVGPGVVGTATIGGEAKAFGPGGQPLDRNGDGPGDRRRPFHRPRRAGASCPPRPTWPSAASPTGA